MTCRRVQSAVKRFIDLMAAMAGLIVLSPVLALAAAAVAVSLGRPVLFRQRRPGQGGRIFTLNKFRTMREPLPGET